VRNDGSLKQDHPLNRPGFPQTVQYSQRHRAWVYVDSVAQYRFDNKIGQDHPDNVGDCPIYWEYLIPGEDYSKARS